MHDTPARRLFILRSCSALFALLAGKFGLAAANRDSFAAAGYDDAIKLLFGAQPVADSGDIMLTIPEVAENGAVVPVGVSSSLNDIRRIFLLVEKNPTPLAAMFTLSAQANAQLSLRIKMAESSHVTAIVQSGAEYFQTRRWVKVVAGGCGTG
ncbi:MAG: thiosulfate oxidation carrier protein SoxY [Methylomonas sp.]|jgi:sulfur-oxidizing protein SoxY